MMINNLQDRILHSRISFGSLSFTVLLFLFFSSCTPTKNAYYFKSLPKDTLFQGSNKPAETRIKVNDLLGVNVSSLNREEDLTYNAAAGGLAVGPVSSGASSSGYLVDANGNIQFHRLGNLRVEGMTRKELKDKLQKDLSPYLKDPVVTVCFLNHRVTILGEVSKPQVIQMPEEQSSLLEVLGSSGDVTAFSRRDNILVIRETKQGKQLKRINLEDRSIFTSEWYYLQPDDVVYVEPNDKKVKEEQRNKTYQTVSIGLSALSTIMVVIGLLIR